MRRQIKTIQVINVRHEMITSSIVFFTITPTFSEDCGAEDEVVKKAVDEKEYAEEALQRKNERKPIEFRLTISSLNKQDPKCSS